MPAMGSLPPGHLMMPPVGVGVSGGLGGISMGQHGSMGMGMGQGQSPR